MDEPFASLDEQTRLLLGAKVTQIQQQLRQTTLLITHSLTEAVQLSDRIVVMTFRPGRVRRIVRGATAAPTQRRSADQPRIRRLCRRALGRSARGGQSWSGGRRARGGLKCSCWRPLFGLATLIAAGAALQALIVGRRHQPLRRAAAIRRARRIRRIVVEEHVPARFLLTSVETFGAGLLILAVGVPIGFWLHRSRPLRRAFEPWVAAWAAAPLVLAYPLFLVLFGRSSRHHRDPRLRRRRGAGDPEDGRRTDGHASRADRCRTIAAIDARPDVPQDPVPGGNAGDLHRACGSD